MKKISIVGIIIGVVVLIAGLAWSGFSWHRIQDDIQTLNSKDYVAKKSTFDSSSVQTIKVNISNTGVFVRTQADVDHVTVDYSETKYDKFVVGNEDGVVSVMHTESKSVNNIFCLLRCVNMSDPVTIYVPADSAYKYDITAGNAPVTFNDTNVSILRVRNIHVSSSNSGVKLQNMMIDGTVKIDSSNGSIRLQDVIATDVIDLGSSNSSTVLIGVKAPTIVSETSNGSATLDSITAKDLRVNTSNASITLKRLMAERSNLTSDNGSISGSIVGARDSYMLDISSENGGIEIDGDKYEKSFVSGANLNKSLTARASNSAIKINFVD